MISRPITRVITALTLLASAPACIPTEQFVPDTRCGGGAKLTPDAAFTARCSSGLAERVEAETTFDAFVAMRGEDLLMRWGEHERPLNLASVRKSVISLLYGIAAERGLLDLDASLADLGIDDAPQPLTDEERRATVRDLLASRSGIYLETLGESSTWADRRPARGSHPHGTFWFYNNWDFNALGTIFEKTTGLSIGHAIAAWLAAPLGMDSFCPEHVTYEWADHTEHPMWRVFMSAGDLARIGALVLQDGRWGGEEVVPAAWITESTSPISDTTALIGADRLADQYGLLWWIDSDTGRIWGQGSGGQFLIVDRARGIATVTRNNTGTSVAGYLWAQTGQHDDEARSSEQLAQALHEEVLSCE